jgi:hypothetical protein
LFMVSESAGMAMGWFMTMQPRRPSRVGTARVPQQ